MVNPYAPAPVDVPPASEGMDSSLLSIAKRVFLAWEKLRLVYIGLLGLFTLALTGSQGLLRPGVLIEVLAGAFVANVLYFAGPTVETYVRWLGYEKVWPRWFLFIGGTMLTMILAVAALASSLLPNPN